MLNASAAAEGPSSRCCPSSLGWHQRHAGGTARPTGGRAAQGGVLKGLRALEHQEPDGSFVSCPCPFWLICFNLVENRGPWFTRWFNQPPGYQGHLFSQKAHRCQNESVWAGSEIPIASHSQACQLLDVCWQDIPEEIPAGRFRGHDVSESRSWRRQHLLQLESM